MKPYNKVYYFTLVEFNESQPFSKVVLSSFLIWLFDLEDATQLAGYQLPSDLTTNASIYNELFSLVCGRYGEEYFIKWVGSPEQEPTSDELNVLAREWGYKFVSLLNMTYEYYVPLLTMYRSAKANLMDDITATSSNTVKFNDTPQNNNVSGTYEGDDYITHFTKTENTSSSPLESKINRLKEIQEGYKNVMADWVKEFEKIFMEAN